MLGFAACSPQPEVRDSDAIMLGEESVTLPAREGEKTVTIYADGKWMASVTDEWLTIEPESGEGTMDITIRYEANNSDLERESAVYVRGSEFAGEKRMTILQKMDRFRELDPVAIADVLAMNEGDLAKVTDCQIMAVAKDAFAKGVDRDAFYGVVEEICGTKSYNKVTDVELLEKTLEAVKKLNV